MSTFIMAIIAIVVLVLAYCRISTTKTHAGEQPAVESINNTDECMEAFVMVLAYAKATLKEERLNSRRARARVWRNSNCAHKEAARKARKEAMSHISSAQREAEARAKAIANALREAEARAKAIAKASQWMTGKSWQDAIGALYTEGKLVSTRSKADIRPAMVGIKTARVTTGKNFLVAKAGIKSVAQKDAEYKSTHKVVGKSRRIAPTWSMWQKVVAKEKVAMLVWLKEEAKNDPYGYRVVANKVAA